jgi:hypothetical protein
LKFGRKMAEKWLFKHEYYSSHFDSLQIQVRKTRRPLLTFLLVQWLYIMWYVLLEDTFSFHMMLVLLKLVDWWPRYGLLKMGVFSVRPDFAWKPFTVTQEKQGSRINLIICWICRIYTTNLVSDERTHIKLFYGMQKT